MSSPTDVGSAGLGAAAPRGAGVVGQRDVVVVEEAEERAPSRPGPRPAAVEPEHPLVARPRARRATPRPGRRPRSRQRQEVRDQRAPCSVSTDSGWNCTPHSGLVRCATPMTTRPVRAVAPGRHGERVRDVHRGQRVVAHRLERRRDPREQPGARRASPPRPRRAPARPGRPGRRTPRPGPACPGRRRAPAPVTRAAAVGRPRSRARRRACPGPGESTTMGPGTRRAPSAASTSSCSTTSGRPRSTAATRCTRFQV